MRLAFPVIIAFALGVVVRDLGEDYRSQRATIERIGCERPYTATMTYTFWYGDEYTGHPVKRTICA